MHVLEAATSCMYWRLQPYVLQAATLGIACTKSSGTLRPEPWQLMQTTEPLASQWMQPA